MVRFLTFVFTSMFLVHFSTGANANILEKVDQFRLPAGDAVVELSVSTGSADPVKFRVARNASGSSRTIVLNSKSVNQQYLFTSRGLWLSAPGSRRAIRIPPLQRLQGNTVIADISQLDYRSGYSVQSSTNENSGGQRLIKLRLESKRKSAFKTIDLWIDREKFFPVKADYFVSSGKLFRKARFAQPQKINVAGMGQTFVSREAQYFDPSGQGKTTTVRVMSIESKSFPRRFFTSDALAKTQW